MYNGGNTDGYGGGIQSHGGSRYSPYGNNATQSHLQAKDMVGFLLLTRSLNPDPNTVLVLNLSTWT